jgi:hypothetical protein
MSFSRTARTNILKNNLARSTFLGLGTTGTTPRDDNDPITGFTEPSTVAEKRYERQPLGVYNSLGQVDTDLSNVDIEDYAADTSTTPATPGGVQMLNVHTLHFGPFANSYTFGYIGIFDARTGGNLLYYAPLTDANGDPTTVSVAANTAFIIEKEIVAESQPPAFRIMMPDDYVPPSN